VSEEIAWPVGMTAQDPDPSARPMAFNPKGFLVAILTDADEAQRAAGALRAAGFADRSLRVFTGEQIVEDYARYTAQQSLHRRVVAALTDDQETIETYQAYAREGRASLWVRVADDDAADRAIRGLAGSATLHIRHYGRREQRDFYLERPTEPTPRKRKVAVPTTRLDHRGAPPPAPIGQPETTP
jgi:hypothetical protein